MNYENDKIDKQLSEEILDLLEAFNRFKNDYSCTHWKLDMFYMALSNMDIKQMKDLLNLIISEQRSRGHQTYDVMMDLLPYYRDHHKDDMCVELQTQFNLALTDEWKMKLIILLSRMYNKVSCKFTPEFRNKFLSSLQRSDTHEMFAYFLKFEQIEDIRGDIIEEFYRYLDIKTNDWRPDVSWRWQNLREEENEERIAKQQSLPPQKTPQQFFLNWLAGNRPDY
jgi:hypothetical protein